MYATTFIHNLKLLSVRTIMKGKNIRTRILGLSAVRYICDKFHTIK